MIANLENLSSGKPFLTDEKWILVDKKPVIERDLLKWGQWMQDSPERIVARTKVNDVLLSTIFLGLDHSFGGPVPLLFETMVMNGPRKGEMSRAGTYDEAVIQPHAMVELVKLHTPMKVGKTMEGVHEKEPA